MLMASTAIHAVFDNLNPKTYWPSNPSNQSLPISQAPKNSEKIGLRKRLSSFTIKIQPNSTSSSSWAFRKSKSMSSLGEFAGNSLRKWWDWSFGWLLTKKPTFVGDLEMNEEEAAMLGFGNKGTWRHIFFKVRTQFKRMVGSPNPNPNQRFKYDFFSYTQNFDNGSKN